jgi:hypothetical protein
MDNDISNAHEVDRVFEIPILRAYIKDYKLWIQIPEKL